jgi:GTP-binding protein HflX
MIEKKLNYTAVEPERALIVAVVRQGQSDLQTKEYLDELAFLASTSNIITLGVYTQKLEKPERFAYVGKGKLEEVQAAVQAYNIDCVIFDDDLTPAQVRNLENQLQIKILDRSLLILNIFSMRAQTSQSKAQVELAQYQYLYPRLTRMWTHLTKQRGGAGMRGPGEKELETDRRIVNDRISLLKEKLRHIERQSDTRKKLRDRLVRVAIVGYTNVGKSTLMNRLTQAGVLAENKLFATVDSTVRKATIGDIPYLLTDTVGFIRKLPTHLIEAFKSTLDEVREADVLLHVVDISSPFHIKQMEVVNGILADIGAGDKPMILAYNKIDALPKEPEGDELLTDAHLAAEATQHLRQALPEGSPKLNAAILKTIEISAEMNIGIQELRHMIFDVVKPLHQSIYPNYMEQVVW